MISKHFYTDTKNPIMERDIVKAGYYNDNDNEWIITTVHGSNAVIFKHDDYSEVYWSFPLKELTFVTRETWDPEEIMP